jgi:hypothetical protein
MPLPSASEVGHHTNLLDNTGLRNGTLKTYPGFSHGMLTINAETLNADLLAFIEG